MPPNPVIDGGSDALCRAEGAAVDRVLPVKSDEVFTVQAALGVPRKQGFIGRGVRAVGLVKDLYKLQWSRQKTVNRSAIAIDKNEPNPYLGYSCCTIVSAVQTG